MKQWRFAAELRAVLAFHVRSRPKVVQGPRPQEERDRATATLQSLFDGELEWLLRPGKGGILEKHPLLKLVEAVAEVVAFGLVDEEGKIIHWCWVSLG